MVLNRFVFHIQQLGQWVLSFSVHTAIHVFWQCEHFASAAGQCCLPRICRRPQYLHLRSLPWLPRLGRLTLFTEVGDSDSKGPRSYIELSAMDVSGATAFVTASAKVSFEYFINSFQMSLLLIPAIS